MFARIALAILFPVTVSAGSGEYRAPEEAWRNSRINFEISDIYFHPVKCFDINEEFTLSCLRGYNEAGRLAEPRMALVSPGTVARLPGEYKIVRDYGAVALAEVRMRAPLGSFRAYIAQRDQETAELLEAAKKLHSESKDKSERPIDYGRLMRDLRAAVPARVPDAMIVAQAINGILTTTDAHSYLLTGASMQESEDGMALKRIGVGVLVQQADRGWSIGEIIPGGAASASDLQPRDVIVEVNGEKVDFRMDVDAVIRRLLGEENTDITLTIEREGRRFQRTLKRKPFQMKYVESRRIGDTGYIKLISFQYQDACSEIKAKLNEFSSAGAKNFILDLRNNGGGIVDQAACIAGLFFGRDKVVYYTRDAISGRQDPAGEKSKEEQVTDAPLAVLVNEASASASELLAGALQDYQRAWIVGERSFGKGSIQHIQSFEHDFLGSVMGFTVKIFAQPSGRTNQGYGIIPDIEVPFKAGATEAERWAPREYDVFPKAIHVVEQKWVQPRPNEVARVESCRAGAKARADVADYQLQEALKVLDCEAP